VHQTITELCAAGTTILLTTHLLDEADRLCQQVAFIANGRLVATGEPRVLKLAHGQRTLQVTLAQHAEATNAATPLEEVILSMDDPIDQAKLAHWIASGRVGALHSREATLEEVFLDVAGIHPA
jgi:ABC-type multidrug transport system ATPase subunit